MLPTASRPERRANAERRLVTVVGPDRRVDLRVPVETTIEELLPHLLRLLTSPEDRAGAASEWRLTDFTGAGLLRTETVEAQGVVDGDLLYLEQGPARPLRAGEERPGSGPKVTVPLWDPAGRRRVTASFAAALLGVAAVILAATRPAGADLAAPVVVAGLLGLGLLAVGARSSTPPSIPCGTGPLALLAVGGWQAGVGHPGHLASGIGAGVGLLVGAVVLLAGGIRCRPLAFTGAILGVVALIVLGGTAACHGPAVAAVASALAVWTLLLQALPSLAVAASGVGRPAEPGRGAADLTEPDPQTAEDMGGARSILTGLLAGTLFGLLACWSLLLGSHGLPAVLLTAAAAATCALRSRLHRRAVEVALLVAAAATGLLAAIELAVLATTTPAARTAGLVVGAGLVALVVAVVGAVPRLPRAGVGTRRTLRRLEIVLRLAVIPLALWAAGVFGTVSAGSAQLTHHL